MDVPFLQSDIYDKFAALQERGAGRAEFWQIVARGVLALLVAILVYFALRALYRRFVPGRERRGKSGWDRAEVEGHLLQVGREMQRKFNLVEIPVSTSLYLFWDVGGLNCGCGGTVLEVGGHEMMIETASDSAPISGEARLVVPDVEGNVLFYDVTVTEAEGDRGRRVSSPYGFASAFMDRACRMSVSLKAAALVVEKGSGETSEDAGEGILVRVLDLSLDGMGLRSEVPIEAGVEVLLRAHMPGYLEPITAQATVAWSREELTGIHRSGLAIAFSGLDLRLIIADYMHLVHCAEKREPELAEIR